MRQCTHDETVHFCTGGTVIEAGMAFHSITELTVSLVLVFIVLSALFLWPIDAC
jgi:hypothetical protein